MNARSLLISGSQVRVLLRPPIISIGYDGIAAKSGRLFHAGDTLGDTFCQGRVTRQAGFVLDALDQALYDRRPLRQDGLIHHSDRGVH